jgi:hypothetical protein
MVAFIQPRVIQKGTWTGYLFAGLIGVVFAFSTIYHITARQFGPAAFMLLATITVVGSGLLMAAPRWLTGWPRGLKQTLVVDELSQSVDMRWWKREKCVRALRAPLADCVLRIEHPPLGRYGGARLLVFRAPSPAGQDNRLVLAATTSEASLSTYIQRMPAFLRGRIDPSVHVSSVKQLFRRPHVHDELVLSELTKCHACGYDLTGILVSVCPECGRPPVPPDPEVLQSVHALVRTPHRGTDSASTPSPDPTR